MKRALAMGLLMGAVLLAGRASFADLIQLKDGRTLSGTMARDGDVTVIHTDAGKTVMTTPEQVVRVTLTSSLTPAQAAEAEWNRTAAAIKKADDLAKIISLHQKFLDKYPDQTMSGAVRTSMEEYRVLQREKAVKFRGRWMAGAQVDVMLKTWRDNARPAIDLYRAGKVREAFERAKAIVVADGDNPAALTIAGMAAFRLNNLPVSKQYFMKLAAADPSSPLAENNLAVIAAQQRSPAEGLLHYARALENGAGNRLLLDNIEEALASYTGAGLDQKIAAYRDLVKTFDQAETRMEAVMAKKNLYRYGSTWVSKDMYAQLTTSKESIEGAMKQLDAQYAQARQNFAAINEQIKQAAKDYNTTLADVNTLNNTVAGSNAVGLDVTSMVSRRESLMADLDRIRAKKTALEGQRDQITASFGAMYAQADKLKAAAAGTKGAAFSGLQRMMELGEDIDPPAPAELAVPKVAAVPAWVAPAAAGGAPGGNVGANQQAEDDVFDQYTVISGPLGYPFFPNFPQRRVHRGDHDRGADHGHDGDYRGGLWMPAGGSDGAAPGVPVIDQGAPGALPGDLSGQIWNRDHDGRRGRQGDGSSTGNNRGSDGRGNNGNGGKVVGTPGGSVVTPGSGGAAKGTGRQPADPTKAVPQGGPGSIWSNSPK